MHQNWLPIVYDAKMFFYYVRALVHCFAKKLRITKNSWWMQNGLPYWALFCLAACARARLECSMLFLVKPLKFRLRMNLYLEFEARHSCTFCWQAFELQRVVTYCCNDLIEFRAKPKSDSSQQQLFDFNQNLRRALKFSGSPAWCVVFSKVRHNRKWI